MSGAVTGATQADIALHRLRKLIPSLSSNFDDVLCEKLRECLCSIDSESKDENILNQLDLKSKTVIMSFLSKCFETSGKSILDLGNIIVTNIIQELKQQSFASEFVVPDTTLKEWCRLFECWVKGSQTSDSNVLSFLESFICLIRLFALQGHINKKRIELLSDHFIPSIWKLMNGTEGIQREIVKLIEECIVGDIYLAEVLATTLNTTQDKPNGKSSKKRKASELSNETTIGSEADDKLDSNDNKTTNKNKSSFCENLINKLSDGYWNRESSFAIKASFIGKIMLAVSATSQKLMEHHTHDTSKSMGKQAQFIDEIVSSRRHILRLLHFSLLLMERVSRHSCTMNGSGNVEGLLGVGVLRSEVLSATVTALGGKALPNHSSLEKYHELQTHLFASTLQTIQQLISKYDHSVSTSQAKEQLTCVVAIAMHMHVLRHLQTIDHRLLLTHVKPVLSILFHASLPYQEALGTSFQAMMMSIWQIYGDLRSQDVLIEAWLDQSVDVAADATLTTTAADNSSSSSSSSSMLVFLLEDYPTIETVIDALRRLPEAKWRALWRKMFYRILPVQSHAQHKAKKERHANTDKDKDTDKDTDIDTEVSSTAKTTLGVTSVSLLHCFVYFIVFRAYQEIPRKHTVIQVGDTQLLHSQGREDTAHLPPLRQLVTALHRDFVALLHSNETTLVEGSVTDTQTVSAKRSLEALWRHRLRLLGAVIDHLMHEFASSLDLLCREDLPALLLVDVTQVLLRCCRDTSSSMSMCVCSEYLTTLNLLEAFRCNVVAKVPQFAVSRVSQVSQAALTPVSVFAASVFVTDDPHSQKKMDTVRRLSLSMRAFHALLQSFFVNDLVRHALMTTTHLADDETQTKTQQSGLWSLMTQGMTAFYDFAALRHTHDTAVKQSETHRDTVWTEAEDTFTRLVAVLSSATYLDVQWIGDTLLATHLCVLQSRDTPTAAAAAATVAQRLVTLATLLQTQPATHYEDAPLETRELVSRLCRLVLRHIATLTCSDTVSSHQVETQLRHRGVVCGWCVLSHYQSVSSFSAVSRDTLTINLSSFLEDTYLLVCGVSPMCPAVSQREMKAVEDGLAALCVAAGVVGKTQLEALYCLQMCLCGAGHAGLWHGGGVVVHSVSRLLQRCYELLLLCRDTHDDDETHSTIVTAEKFATQCLTRLRDAYEVVMLQNSSSRRCDKEVQREALGAYATLYAEHLFALCRVHSLATSTSHTSFSFFFTEEKVKRLERFVDFSVRLLQWLEVETHSEEVLCDTVLSGGWLRLFAATVAASLCLSSVCCDTDATHLKKKKKNKTQQQKQRCVAITSLEDWVTPVSRVMTQYYAHRSRVAQWSVSQDSCVTGRVAAAVSSLCLAVSQKRRDTDATVSFLKRFADAVSSAALQWVSRHSSSAEEAVVSSVSQVAVSCVMGHTLRRFLRHTQQQGEGVSRVSLKPLLSLYATQLRHTAVSLSGTCSGVAGVSSHCNTVSQSLLATLSSELRDTQDTLVRCTVSHTTSFTTSFSTSLDKRSGATQRDSCDTHMDDDTSDDTEESDDSVVTDDDTEEDTEEDRDTEDDDDTQEENEQENDEEDEDETASGRDTVDRDTRVPKHHAKVYRDTLVDNDTDNSDTRVLQAMWASVLPPLCLELTAASCVCLRLGGGCVSSSSLDAVSQVWYDVSQLFYAYFSVWVKQQGGVATHVPSATALVSRSLHLLVQHLPHLFVATTSSSTAAAAGRRVTQVVSRLCALLPAVKALLRHLPPLFAHLVLAVSHPAPVSHSLSVSPGNNNVYYSHISDNHSHISSQNSGHVKAMTDTLQPGLLALYEALTSRDRRTVFAQLDATARTVMNELNDEYQRNYRFVGN